jgi:hypothetical protein
VEALTKQNGFRLFGKLKKSFKKKVKTDLPYPSFYKKKPETHIFFFWPYSKKSHLDQLFHCQSFQLLIDECLSIVMSIEEFLVQKTKEN